MVIKSQNLLLLRGVGVRVRAGLNIRERGRGANKIEQVRKRGGRESKFWSFCDNVIIECPNAKMYNRRKNILRLLKSSSVKFP